MELIESGKDKFVYKKNELIGVRRFNRCKYVGVSEIIYFYLVVLTRCYKDFVVYNKGSERDADYDFLKKAIAERDANVCF